MEVRFVTSNLGKFQEAREILAPFGLRVRRLPRVLPEPQTDRLETVVRAKLAALPASSRPTVVEDSGLFIESLNGFPGVYSAHFYRIWGFDPLLELLRRRSRGATFRTVVGLRVGHRVRLFEGTCHGSIGHHARGRHGFGFDPLFRPDGARRTFAEMETTEKNRFSHRAAAFRKVGRALRAAARRDLRARPSGRKSKGTKPRPR